LDVVAQFHEDVATKIIWGPSQTLAIWVLDSDTGSEWKIRRDDQWQQMIEEKWDERMAHIAVEVTAKAGYENRESLVASKVSNTANPARSGVTTANVDGASSAGTNAEGIGDSCFSPPQDGDEPVPTGLHRPS